MSSNIGIYIHIPYCKRKCDYCSFVSVDDFSSQKEYVERLKEEISLRAKTPLIVESDKRTFVGSDKDLLENNNRKKCDSIFIGGGTPSVLYRGGIADIASCIRDNFDVDNSVEFTVESNPESCSDEFLSECLTAGVNRISLGLQSCDDNILKRAGRLHDYDGFRSAFERARKVGVKNISVDLIIGLEGETTETFCTSLEKVIALSPEHISVYSLSVEEGTKLFNRGVRTDDDFMRKLYDLAVSTLEKAGFYRYEVSNFARKGFESRHNIKYWTLSPYLGFGVVAHSYYHNIRRANTNSLETYLDETYNGFVFTEQDVSCDAKEEFIMLGLRMEKGLSLNEYFIRFGTNLLEERKTAIDNLLKKGYIIIENDFLKINADFMYVMNAIILELIG